MTQPSYDELLQYTYALEHTLEGLLEAVLDDIDARHIIPLVQTVDRSMTLSIRTTVPVEYVAHLPEEIQRLRTHIPGVPHD
jgi:hypothetical protein